jgi:hypothetical protein
MNNIYSVSQYQRLLAKFSDCSCDLQMGKKMGKFRKGSKAERDSEEEESATSQMSGTSFEKSQQEFRTAYTTPSYHQLQHDVYSALKRQRRLAETREELWEANREALRLAAAPESSTEAPNIFGPGNVFDAGDDDHEELEELRTQNAELLHRLRGTGAAARLASVRPGSLARLPSPDVL